MTMTQHVPLTLPLHPFTTNASRLRPRRQNTFNGDVLELIAKYPLLVLLTVAGITGASLVPTCAPQGYFPDALKETTMKAYEGAGLGDIFSAKAEMINGRAAMLGMAVFIATATIF